MLNSFAALASTAAVWRNALIFKRPERLSDLREGNF